MPFNENEIDRNEQDLESNEHIFAPTQATLEKVNVGLGDNVSIGDSIVVLTAMKMEVSKIKFIIRIHFNFQIILVCSQS